MDRQIPHSVTFTMQKTYVNFFPDTYQLLKPKKCWQDVCFHFPQLLCSIQYLLIKQWPYYTDNVTFHSHKDLKLILSCWKLISPMALRQQKPFKYQDPLNKQHWRDYCLRCASRKPEQLCHLKEDTIPRHATFSCLTAVRIKTLSIPVKSNTDKAMTSLTTIETSIFVQNSSYIIKLCVILQHYIIMLTVREISFPHYEIIFQK